MADYVYDILSMNVCDTFFGGSFVKEEQNTYGYFDTHGYRQLATIKSLKADEYFDMLSKLLILLGNARRCYINPDKMVVNEKTIYVGKNFSDIKLVPVFDFVSEEGEIIQEFMKWAYNKVRDKDKKFVRASMKYATKDKYSDREINSKVAKLGREARLAT